MKTSSGERLRISKIEAAAFGLPVNTYLLQQIQSSYSKALGALVRNPEALAWIQFTFHLEAKDLLWRISKTPPPGVSKGLASFLKYMTGLEGLARERLLTSVQQEERRLKTLRVLWRREKYFLKDLEALKVAIDILQLPNLGISQYFAPKLCILLNKGCTYRLGGRLEARTSKIGCIPFLS